MGPRSIYLDQNKWVDLGRAYHGRPNGAKFAKALATAERAVEAEAAFFPLSVTHYEETGMVTDFGRRDRLAEVMEALSHFTTIASQLRVVPVELERALHRRLGRPAKPGELVLYGFGAAHAFDDEGLAYRPPRELPPEIQEQFVAVARAAGLDVVLERALLRSLGLDAATRTAARAADQQFLNSRATAQGVLKSHGAASGSALRDGVFGMVLAEIWEPLVKALSEARITLDDFFANVSLGDFVLDLPSRRVIAELQRVQHAGGAPFKRGDLNDLGFLAVAVAYCDVVITENQWAHVIRQAKLDQLFDTVVTDDVTELPDILATNATAA
jgi:dienelactone hydrolase